MKKMTCANMGGPCDHEMVAETQEEMMMKGMEHVKAAHPEMVHDIENMTPEQSAEWQKGYDAAWAAAPMVEEAPHEDVPMAA